MKNLFLSAHMQFRALVLFASCTAPALTVFADSYSVLHNLTVAEGSGIAGPLTLSGSTLYGTCYAGGLSNSGTVFKLTTDGSGCTVLHSFIGPPTDGSAPYQGLLLSDSSLYGTTAYGGISNCGTVFKVNTDGSGYVVLRQFTGPPDDGANPYSSLVLGSGLLFGTTDSGGRSNCGIVFKIGIDGSGYSVLKHFTGPTAGNFGEGDGAMPRGRLVLLENTLYGGTLFGGPAGKGVIYQLNLDNSAFSLLKEGTDTDGDHFQLGLLNSGTTLFGSTPWGGGGIGCVYSLNTDGSAYRVLKAFTGFDGVGTSSLVLAGPFLYGTSGAGAISNAGTVFTLQTNGNGFVLLKEFSGGAEGTGPGSLVASGSCLYGAASISGSSFVFRLPLPVPTMTAVPQTQTAEVGATVTLSAMASGLAPLTYLWFQDAAPIIASTNRHLTFPAIQPSQAGVYTVVVTNAFGSITSPPAILNVISGVPRRLVPALALTGLPGSFLLVQSSPTAGPWPVWSLLSSVMLTNSPQWIADLSVPVLSQNYYRASGTTPPPATLHLAQVPAIALAGTVGAAIRIDYINQFGPVDAWQELETVTLAAPSQDYVDTSAPGQPPRLYRVSTAPK
jgi:uncharacterized repeat protein (TIGR03803 family)